LPMDAKRPDEAPPLRKPDLPRRPKPPDLRKVRDPAKRQTKEAAYAKALADFLEQRREYDEVLYPAYEKAQRHAYEQTEQRKRKRQEERQRAQKSAAAVIAAKEAKEREAREQQRLSDVAECERLKQAERQAFADAMHRLDLTVARQTYPTFILSEIGRYSRKQHDKKNRKKHR
jgi:hypothetical protein